MVLADPKLCLEDMAFPQFAGGYTHRTMIDAYINRRGLPVSLWAFERAFIKRCRLTDIPMIAVNDLDGIGFHHAIFKADMPSKHWQLLLHMAGEVAALHDLPVTCNLSPFLIAVTCHNERDDNGNGGGTASEATEETGS